MKHEVIGTCPVCGNDLTVTKLSCGVCHTEISGDFALSKFSALNKDDLNFIETFIKVSGNIREMEKSLGISYPTVKKNLDGIIIKLGLETVEALPEVDEEEILEKLKNKEITVEEAAQYLRRGI